MSLPYDYYPTVLQVITLISQGRTETSACDEYSLSIATFRKYVRADETLTEQYEEAIQRGHDAMAEALLNPFDTNKHYGESDVAKAKLVSDNIKWFLSKRASGMYGEKVEVKHTVTADRAITQALERARQRSQNGEIIDVTPTLLVEAAVQEVVEQTDDEIRAELGLL